MLTLECNLYHLRVLFREEWEEVTTAQVGKPLREPYYSTDLLRLMAEHHTQPIENLESAVRTIVQDAGSVGNVGVAEHHDLDIILTVLERVRRKEIMLGDWGETMPDHPMCG